MLKKVKKIFLIFLLIMNLMKYYFISYVYTISKNFVINNKKILLKKIILSKIFNITKKNIKNINSLFIKGNYRFGNFFLAINNALIFCEILYCKKIIIENNNNIYINKRIFYKQSNFTIEPNQSLIYMDNYSIILDLHYFFYNIYRPFRNLNRLGIFREQLLNNLPKVIVNPNDLYIYIRSGDIFVHAHRAYFQPPLCFYVKILEEFKFNKVYIISEDKLNPVIPNLMSNYSYIKKKRNSLKLDISYLINAYNMVAARSTFFSVSIKLNNKLKFFWEYDFYSSLSIAFLDFHYSWYKFPVYYTIYKMNSSINYRKIMIPWINSPNQRKFLIEEKCMSNFDIINKNLNY